MINKSYMATDDTYSFMVDNGVTTTIELDFRCLIKNEWAGKETQIADNAIDAITFLDKSDYSIVVNTVSEEQLDWLNVHFDYGFCCNDEPSRYADLCDHWTIISPTVETKLLKEKDFSGSRRIKYQDNWAAIVEIIKDDDGFDKSHDVVIKLEDTDWNQKKACAYEISDSSGTLPRNPNDCFIAVEKLNEKTTELLLQISSNEEIPEFHQVPQKPEKERWSADEKIWTVKKEICETLNCYQITITQVSLYYRGTWLEMCIHDPRLTLNEKNKILRDFIKEYGFANYKSADYKSVYDNPWPEGQREREGMDDLIDFSYNSLQEEIDE